MASSKGKLKTMCQHSKSVKSERGSQQEVCLSFFGGVEIKLFSRSAAGTPSVVRGGEGAKLQQALNPEQDLLLVLDQRLRRGRGFQFKLSPMSSFH